MPEITYCPLSFIPPQQPSGHGHLVWYPPEMIEARPCIKEQCAWSVPDRAVHTCALAVIAKTLLVQRGI